MHCMLAPRVLTYVLLESVFGTISVASTKSNYVYYHLQYETRVMWPGHLAITDPTP